MNIKQTIKNTLRLVNTYAVDSPQPANLLKHLGSSRSFSNSSLLNSQLGKKFSNNFNWYSFDFPTYEEFISALTIEQAINEFWKKVMIKVSDNQHIILITRIKYVNGNIATLGSLQKLSQLDKEFIIKHLQKLLTFKTDEYTNTSLHSILFNYSILDGTIDLRQDNITSDLPTLNFYHYKLPVTINPLEYGDLISSSGNTYVLYLKSGNIAEIRCEDNCNHVKIYRKGLFVLEYTDKKTSDNTFIRTINRNTYYYENNNLLLVESIKKTKPITSKKPEKAINNKFITMDIETKVEDNNHQPYSIGIFDGIKRSIYYLSDFSDSEDMIKTAVKSVLIPKYKNYKVYFHNLSSFDGISNDYFIDTKPFFIKNDNISF